jgi:hypothetical protein
VRHRYDELMRPAHGPGATLGQRLYVAADTPSCRREAAAGWGRKDLVEAARRRGATEDGRHQRPDPALGGDATVVVEGVS